MCKRDRKTSSPKQISKEMGQLVRARNERARRGKLQVEDGEEGQIPKAVCKEAEAVSSSPAAYGTLRGGRFKDGPAFSLRRQDIH